MAGQRQSMIEKRGGTGIESAGDMMRLLVFTSRTTSIYYILKKFLNSGVEGTSACGGVHGR